MFADIITSLARFNIGDLIDIIIVTFILYYIFSLIKDTKAYQMAIGLGIIGVLFLISELGNLVALNWLIKIFSPFLIIAIIVLFQGEIRRFLTTLGSRSFRKPLSLKSFTEKLENIFLAVDYLASKKIGALIAIEKEISLKSYTDRGTKINGDHSSICSLPASHNLGKKYLPRTRHLAAIGLSQETDAAVIVVSEETGTVSLATKGQLERKLDKKHLKERMLNYLQVR